MSELPKMCPTCKFFDYWGGSPAYSSWTPAESGRIGCDKNHWSLGEYSTLADARKAMLTALTCKDFRLHRENGT